MKYLNSADSNFIKTLSQALFFEQSQDNSIESVVAEICNDVKIMGDLAVLKYTKRFDHLEVASVNDLTLESEELKQAFESLPEKVQKALVLARDRIQNFHEHQVQKSWQYKDEFGHILGQKITPIDRVGIYVPGGKAAYPSSVLMNAIPAKVAGVKDILMVVPTPFGEKNLVVLGAAYIAGVTKVITIGGVQAIAALAYGTESIPAVNKITGPGNAYVATAKKYVFGQVGIDMIAGPSEILVIADGSTDPNWVVMDLFSQAEHDEMAQSILISDNEDYIQTIQKTIDKLIALQPRKDIIQQSLNNRGIIIKAKDLTDACEIANYIAPEHLELSVENPDLLLEKIHNAGAIFLGAHSSESIGDYCAGPNHVLPTARTARFASPLGVYDFQKKSNIIKINPNSDYQLEKTANILATEEGLIAHALAAEIRIPK
ncbi:histidinol dehydrogenase [Neisseriaceae bacterium PsAf]|nr:histidinol dehydrogenase [Neisseriaceae bacterium PsAf]MCV2503071.1 histidinol dehydrogenase [Neisseriaceae bacterium]